MSFTGTLFAFQQDAVEVMLERRRVLVAYEMGLGKTVITIAAAEELIDSGQAETVLVIAPNSVKRQWAREIDKFTEKATWIVVEGQPHRRVSLYEDFLNDGADYLIINYNQLVDDWQYISRLHPDVVIADEVSYIKNFKPKRSKRLKKLESRYRWGLTGQPVENKAEEVYSIMQWIDRDVLGDFKTFDSTFVNRNPWGGVRAYKNLPTLHKTLKKAMVRRTREEVKDQLPAVMEESWLVDFDTTGAKLYRHVAAALLNDLDEALASYGNFDVTGFYTGNDMGGKRAQGQIASKLTCLRMLCDHPELLRISAEHFGRINSARSGSQYAATLAEAGRLDPLKGTPKLDATIELVKEILDADPGNKIVLFSFFKDMLKILGESTATLTRSVSFTGDMNTLAREASRAQFASDPDTRLFLSSDAGGMGLDLPMANFLVSYDLPWSAGAYAQRMARIIRLSSVFPQVTMISMQMADTVEERQYDMLLQKGRIASAVVDGKGIDSKGRLTLDLKSLRDFLMDKVVTRETTEGGEDERCR